ncbi:MAG: fluoride exporter [Thermoleophilaceae bacterium]|nr:fluoride exporter [Thermoleophilaceae bacterium]
MSALVWLAVGLLGGVGAIGRFALDSAVSERVGSQLPWGTFAVNVSGSFLLGLLAGVALSGDALLLAGVALLGSYTTFSTWMLESHRLAEQGRRGAVALNLAGSVAVGIGAAALGRLIGGAL